MKRRILVPVLLLALTVGLALAPGPVGSGSAGADEFEEMRDEFRKGMKSEKWKERRDSFMYISDLDRPESVDEILSVLAKEENAAVVLAGVEALAMQKSLGSREVLFRIARKGKGRQRLLVLLALAQQKGPDVQKLLIEVAGGRDAQAAAQAAMSLKEEKPAEALPALLALAKHKDWQVRRAAAVVLAEYGAEEAVGPLVAGLALAKGRDRYDIIQALEKITGQVYGSDLRAWKKLAAGEDPKEIQGKPELAPTVFGVPIYGRRVVICLDNSLRMTDPHPFDSDRLRKLCDPKDGDPIPWFRMKTNGHFAHGHVKHLLKGLPKGVKFELVTFNAMVRDTFAGFASVGSASRKIALETIDSLQTDDGIDAYGALTLSLDRGGAKDAAAWNKGPDEIIYITVNMPTAGEIKEADVVAAAIGLKARLRMVPIHTVGIHFHPYDMCRDIAGNTGGVYVDLTK